MSMIMNRILKVGEEGQEVFSKVDSSRVNGEWSLVNGHLAFMLLSNT